MALIEDVERVALRSNEARLRRSAAAGIVLRTLAGVVCGLLAGEAFLRFARPYQEDVHTFAAAAVVRDAALSHRLRPLSHVEVGGIDYRVSSLGTRGPEPAAHPDARVLVLGDSVTMGWGVAEGDTWPSRVEAALSGHVRGLEVVNAAVLAWGVEEYAVRLDELWPRLAPDLVIIGYYPNDPEGTDSVLPSGGARSRVVELLFGSGPEPRTADTLVRRDVSDTRTSLPAPRPADATEHERALHAEGSTGWRKVERAFTRIGRRCRQASVPCVVALLPSLNETPYPLGPEHRRLADLARAHGLHVVDVAPVLDSVDAGALWVARDDAHPNARGHALYAQRIAAFLEGAQLVPGSGSADLHGPTRGTAPVTGP